MNLASPSRQPSDPNATRAQDARQPRAVELIPHVEMERNAQIARINAERERLAKGDALRRMEQELKWREITGRPLSREAVPREPERPPQSRERER